ncbi:MAG: hypothetical protein ACT4OY_04600 [Alphaproteobacteria bacterium]
MRFLTLIVTAIILTAGFSPAFAATLTSDQVKQFTNAIPDIEAFSTKMQKEGKDKALEKAVRPKPGESQFTPYTKGVVALKSQFPPDYTALSGVVSKHGFATPEIWANVGDSVMQAYLATKMQGKNMEAMQAMAKLPPEMKAKLPPQAKAQIEQATSMLKIVNAAPAANKEAIKPHIPAIDAWLQREEAKMKASAAAKGAKPAALPPTPKKSQ